MQKCAEYNMQPEYQASHRKSAHKSYWSKKDVEFPPDPPSADLCQKIVSGFCADTSPDVFEETGCAVCGKLFQFMKWKIVLKLRISICLKNLLSESCTISL